MAPAHEVHGPVNLNELGLGANPHVSYVRFQLFLHVVPNMKRAQRTGHLQVLLGGTLRQRNELLLNALYLTQEGQEFAFVEKRPCLWAFQLTRKFRNVQLPSEPFVEGGKGRTIGCLDGTNETHQGRISSVTRCLIEDKGKEQLPEDDLRGIALRRVRWHGRALQRGVDSVPQLAHLWMRAVPELCGELHEGRHPSHVRSTADSVRDREEDILQLWSSKVQTATRGQETHCGRNKRRGAKDALALHLVLRPSIVQKLGESATQGVEESSVANVEDPIKGRYFAKFRRAELADSVRQQGTSGDEQIG
mmetsp:Transcript_39866/g.105735  ORF Transcript_39866/g.105735 Transcript_39866/m.105735 type:complete len:306 (-) Transcript_39866:445-1362(-)